jgi:hypothetical protein
MEPLRDMRSASKPVRCATLVPWNRVAGHGDDRRDEHSAVANDVRGDATQPARNPLPVMSGRSSADRRPLRA